MTDIIKKSSVSSKIAENKNDSTAMLFSLSQDNESFQNSEDTLQRESECSMDSGSSLQNVQLGDCERPKRNSFSIVGTICCIEIISVWN